MVWAQLATAIGSAAYNEYGQGKANDATEARFGQGLAAQQEAARRNQALRAQQLQQAYRGLADVRQGYDRALGSVSAQGVNAGREVAALARQGRAQSQARGYSTGLLQSTARAGLTQQAAFDAQRAQGSIAERLAAMRARLNADRGVALAGARSNIGNVLAGRGEAGVRDSQNLIELLGSRQDTFAPVDWSSLGVAVDNAFSSGSGGANTNTPSGKYSNYPLGW